MIKEICKFVSDNRKWFYMVIFGTLGAAFGRAVSEEKVQDALVNALDDVHITVGPSTPPPAKKIPVADTDGDKINYENLGFYGRQALVDKQNHELKVLKMKQDHELEMAKIKAEQEAPKDE